MANTSTVLVFMHSFLLFASVSSNTIKPFSFPGIRKTAFVAQQPRPSRLSPPSSRSYAPSNPALFTIPHTSGIVSIRKASNVRFLTPLLALPPATAQDLGGAALVGMASAVWLKLWTSLAISGAIDSKDSRKLIHCGSGPLFLLCWPFFSAEGTARLFAAGVPLLQIVAMIASGLAKAPSPAKNDSGIGAGESAMGKPSGLVAAISRSGNPAEVLRGPLIYVVILLLATVVFWRESVVGLVAVAQMAAGDGMADIVGRRWGAQKWSFSSTKSYAGSSAFALSGFVVSVALIAWFNFWGLVPALTAGVACKVALISILCAAVELVPWGDDNIFVPMVASALASWLL